MKKRQKILILLMFMVGSLMLTACQKNKEEQESTEDVTLIPTQEVTPTLVPKENEDDTDNQDLGEEKETDTDTKEEYLSESQAIKKIQNIIGERGYFIETLDDHLRIGENTYYIFQISDSSDVIEPNVIVDKISGELLCYYTNGSTASFTEYPLYTTKDNDSEKEEDQENKFTKEDALTQLSSLSAKTLRLEKELSEFTIIFDDWPTNVKGTECYGINAYEDLGERMAFMGTYYVTIDGSKMYMRDSVLDEFVEIE